MRLKNLPDNASRVLLGVVVVLVQWSLAAPGQTTATNTVAQIRFVDSATGYGIQPQSVTTRSHSPGALENQVRAAMFSKSGRVDIALQPGRHTITVASPEYSPMTAEVEVAFDNPFSFRFLLDPLAGPPEFEPSRISSLLQEDSTLVAGFVVDEETAQPLAGVQVSCGPSGMGTKTDARGFFQILVPAQRDDEAQKSPAHLLLEKRDFETQERQFLELLPGTDLKYQLSLRPGNGKQVLDERAFRRRSAPPADSPASDNQPDPPVFKGSLDAPGPASRTVLTNSTVRVPRNIRVLQQSGTVVDYLSLDNYAKHVLPAEWIASWGSSTYPGGTNCLNAGAVAVRCYAVVKLNAVSGSSAYDICATTSCQVYNPATSNGLTDTAVNYTANWVVVSSSGSISSTEYSAENNSLANTCGDGFTEPSTTGPVCIYDPVCVGETRNGHGRGMCQWGTAKWASGRKHTGNITSSSSPTNGYPRRDWTWIVQHYYPTLFLVKGAPLQIGDDVKALTTLNVRDCGGTITNGIYCSLVTTRSVNMTGTIIGGPVQVTADAGGTNGPGGFTWYQVQWSDLTVGWSQENYLERQYSLPSAPTNLVATAAATNQIYLTWSDSSSGVADYFKIERAISSSGPWIQLTNIDSTVTTYSDKNLPLASTWFYRARANNSGGNSPYSAMASATTSNLPPTLAAIGNKTVTEGSSLTLTNSATGVDFTKLITDFEPFASEGSNGIVMFRDPRFSGSTTPFIDSAPDLALVTDTFPAAGNGSGHVLRISCNFTNPANPWLRLTTASAGTFPNPVIDFTKRLRFNIYADKAIQVAVGCRETATPGGTAFGADGGTTGGIEWAGVTNIAGTAPMPARTVNASNWTTLTFDFPNEPIRNFSGGNGILSTASGLGVLEHLAIVPAGGTGPYNIYLDNIGVVVPRTFTYSLGAGSPAGITLDATTGVFAWTPTEAQGPGTNTISVIMTDNSSQPLSLTNTFIVVVLETNSAPVLAAISNRTVHAGAFVSFTNSASDADIPFNALTYSLDPGAPPAAAVDSMTGIFAWQTADTDANAAFPITVRVTDNGSPPLSDFEPLTITVLPKPTIQSLSASGGNVAIVWSAISGVKYRVQFKDLLSDPVWSELAPDILATGSTASTNDTPRGPQRFYRILVVN